MDKGKKIPCVTKCLHLGNSISTTGTQRSLINNAIAGLNIESNNPMAEFSFSNSSTLSVLFKSYCMNIYRTTLWRYNNHSNIDHFCVSWKKIVRRLWKTPYRTHNSLDHLINNCVSLDCILEKRCANCYGIYSIVTMYYLGELLDIPCTIVTPLLVKMLGILCINTRLYMMIGLMTFLIYLTELIIKLKILHSWMIFV